MWIVWLQVLGARTGFNTGECSPSFFPQEWIFVCQGKFPPRLWLVTNTLHQVAFFFICISSRIHFNHGNWQVANAVCLYVWRMFMHVQPTPWRLGLLSPGRRECKNAGNRKRKFLNWSTHESTTRTQLYFGEEFQEISTDAPERTARFRSYIFRASLFQFLQVGLYLDKVNWHHVNESFFWRETTIFHITVIYILFNSFELVA